MNEARHAFVIFGITGDLAREMTLRALYQLEQRELLDGRLIGVAREDIDVQELRSRAHEAIAANGLEVDEVVFKRLAGRLTYIHGELDDDGTYKALAEQVGEIENRLYYLEIPPDLFATVVAGLDKAGLLSRGNERVLVEKPFGHDLASARQLAAQLHEHIAESQLYRIDHFLGKAGLEEILYMRFANTPLEPVWNRGHLACVQITMFESFGVERRGGFFDPVGALRDVVVNHLMQVLAAAAMEPPAGESATDLQDAKRALLRAVRDARPDRYVRGQYEGYRAIEGVAPDSQTETFVALELEIDNWRWAGVPFLIRHGKRMAVSVTELRLIFKQPPTLLFAPERHRRPQPAQIVVKLDPNTGVQMLLEAHRADTGAPGELALDMQFPLEGEEGPVPYEVLLSAALRRDDAYFTRQDNVEECWRIMQRVLDEPGPVEPYDQESWGPAQADRLAEKVGGWRGPWTQEPA